MRLSVALSAPSLKEGCGEQEAPFYSLGSPSLAQGSCKGRDLVNVVCLKEGGVRSTLEVDLPRVPISGIADSGTLGKGKSQ